jgi:hypothetical protein
MYYNVRTTSLVVPDADVGRNEPARWTTQNKSGGKLETISIILLNFGYRDSMYEYTEGCVYVGDKYDHGILLCFK